MLKLALSIDSNLHKNGLSNSFTGYINGLNELNRNISTSDEQITSYRKNHSEKWIVRKHLYTNIWTKKLKIVPKLSSLVFVERVQTWKLFGGNKRPVLKSYNDKIQTK